MKGSDTHYMLAYIKHYITLVRDSIQHQMAQNHKELTSLEKKEQEDIRQIKEVEALEFGYWQTIDSELTQRLSTSQRSLSSASDIVEVGSINTSQIADLFTQPQNNKSPLKGSPARQISGRPILTHDEIGIRLKHICKSIAVMSVDLQEIWKDMDGKVEPLVAPDPALNEIMRTTTKTSDYAAIPACDKGLGRAVTPDLLSKATL